MTPVSASLRCAVFCAALALSGCQTTGTNKWIPANPNADDTVAASGDSDVPVAGAQETAFELGSKDPYAYKDIPPGVRPALDTREAGLWLMVDKIEEKGKTAGNRLTDARMNAYLEEIVCNMSGPYCRDVRVYIQRVPLFNASMAPNGMMTVFSGFLLRVQNEAQLAAVIGHEIGHYIRRHSVQRLEDAIAKHDFAMVFGMFAAGIGVPVAGDVVQLALLGSQYSFSRDNEREADLIGINLMHMRGYDAREAGKIWELLLRERDPETDPDDVSTSAPFASTHPSSSERMKTLGLIAEKLQGPGNWGVTNEQRFDEIVIPWKFRFLQDEIRLRNWKSSLELLAILKEYGHNESEVKYFEGEIFRNRDKEADADAEEEADRISDAERALEAYEKSISLQGTPPQAYRAAGLLYLKKSNAEKARSALQRYLQLVPDATDRKLIQYMLDNAGGLTS